MPHIFDLSAITTLRPISNVLAAFTDLCDKYAKPGWFSCTFFCKHNSNRAWVQYQYYRHIAPLITRYQLGQIDSNAFLNGLLNIFYFLKNPQVAFTDEDKQTVWRNRETLVTLQNKTRESDLTPKIMALALLEMAWNEMIGFNPEETNYMLDRLFEMSKEERLYIIGNTDPINLKRILILTDQCLDTITAINDTGNMMNDLGSSNPARSRVAQRLFQNFLEGRRRTYQWDTSNVDLKTNSDTQIIPVGNNIYLCPSYRFKALMTEKENRAANNLQPSLLDKLVTALSCRKEQIQFFSEQQTDLAEARRLGIPEANVHETKVYFSSSQHVKAA